MKSIHAISLLTATLAAGISYSTISGCSADNSESAQPTAEATNAFQEVGSTSNPAPGADTPNDSPQNVYLMVSGSVDLFENTVSFRQPRALPLANPATVEPGEYNLQVFDFNSNILHSSSFDVTTTSAANSANFNLPVVLPDKPIAKAEVSRQGTLLGSVTGSASVPTVTFAQPFKTEFQLSSAEFAWESTDADGDELTYFLYFSADAGLSWRSIASNYKQKSIVPNTGFLEKTEAALLLITASDGLNAGFVVSAPFSIR